MVRGEYASHPPRSPHLQEIRPRDKLILVGGITVHLILAEHSARGEYQMNILKRLMKVYERRVL